MCECWELWLVWPFGTMWVCEFEHLILGCLLLFCTWELRGHCQSGAPWPAILSFSPAALSPAGFPQHFRLFFFNPVCSLWKHGVVTECSTHTCFILVYKCYRWKGFDTKKAIHHLAKIKANESPKDSPKGSYLDFFYQCWCWLGTVCGPEFQGDFHSSESKVLHVLYWDNRWYWHSYTALFASRLLDMQSNIFDTLVTEYSVFGPFSKHGEKIFNSKGTQILKW